MAQVWSTFDDWTLTAVGQRDRMLQMNGVGQDCDVPANWSAQVGAFHALDGGFYVYGSGVGDYRRLRMNTYTIGNGRVYARVIVDNNYGGIYVRGQDTADRDNYSLIANIGSDTLQLSREDNGVVTVLGTTANNYSTNDILNLMVSCDAGGVTGTDESNNVTVGRVADTTYTAAGYAGVWGSNLVTGHTSVDWLYIYSSLNSGTAISTTFDAGSSVNYTVLMWAESLNGGDVTWDVSARTDAAAANNFATTGLTNPAGSTFDRTGRYWNLRANLSRTSTTQNAGVVAGSARLGSGSTTQNFFDAKWFGGFG